MANLRLALVGLLLASATTINGHKKPSASSPKGRLLTPEEGCGISDKVNTRIVGGATAKNGAWPWMALLFFRDKKDKNDISFSCGGSLITSKHVLTAAHCVEDDDDDELVFVRLGEYDTRTTTDGPHEDIGIAHIESHSRYNTSNCMNDIALIYLERNVKFNDRIRPICLPINGDMLQSRFVGSNPFLAGWGYRKETKKKMSDILIQVQLPIVSNRDCEKSYKKIDQVEKRSQFDDRVVCAGFTEGGKDSCQGDSGGPLMLPVADHNGHFSFYQIGVVSWATGCGRPNLPGKCLGGGAWNLCAHHI